MKFCGGCNPVYNRRRVLERLQSDFPEAVIRFVSEAPEQELESRVSPGALPDALPDAMPDDLALILCGCRNECLDYSRYTGKHGQILVFSEDDYARVKAFMTAWGETTP